MPENLLDRNSFTENIEKMQMFLLNTVHIILITSW